MPMANKRQKKTQSRRRSTGRFTTDVDEIERRRLPGANESFQIESQANGSSKSPNSPTRLHAFPGFTSQAPEKHLCLRAYRHTDR